MYSKKSLLTIFAFLIICSWFIAISITARSNQLNNIEAQEQKYNEISEFVDVHFFKTVDNKPNFELKSTELFIENQRKYIFLSPVGLIHSKKRKINYTADKGWMNSVSKDLNLEGNVELKDAQTIYKSDNLTYDGAKDFLAANGNVKSFMTDQKTKDKVTLFSDRLNSVLSSKVAEFDGNVEGEIKRRRRYEGDVKFGAEKVIFNSLESLINLYKSVKIRRNSYRLTSGSAEIFLENFNKKLKYYVLYDDVKLVEKVVLPSGKKQLRRAFAEKLEAHQRLGKVVLTGAPRVEQGEDTIKGYQITLRENVELVEVDDAKSNFSLKKDKND